MDHLLPISWHLSLIVLTIYYLFIFRIRKKRSSSVELAVLPGVSIVIAVKNGSQSLRESLMVMIRQDYPNYEIILVDDYSKPNEQKELEAFMLQIEHVKVIRSDRAPGKKHALSLGIEKANHALILCTDADCKPIAPQWIRTMVSKTTGEELVLGYSPYFRKAGLLNQFIRFETVMTGIQYLSWAMLGRPYMGVGRNMLYPKAAFLKSNPFKASQDIPYGDDDLFVQAVRAHIPVKVSLDPASFVNSEPATTIDQWIRQKHRHLSAGRYYALWAWLQPGIFGLCIMAHWFLLLPMLWYQISVGFTIAFFAGVGVRWFRYAFWTGKLGDGDTKWFYPWYEIGYAFYLAGMGLMAIIAKKKTWN